MNSERNGGKQGRNDSLPPKQKEKLTRILQGGRIVYDDGMLDQCFIGYYPEKEPSNDADA